MAGNRWAVGRVSPPVLPLGTAGASQGGPQPSADGRADWLVAPRCTRLAEMKALHYFVPAARPQAAPGRAAPVTFALSRRQPPPAAWGASQTKRGE